MSDDNRWPTTTPGLRASVRRMTAADKAMEKAMGPDPTKTGIFRDHNCAWCRDGELPCRQGQPTNCDYPRARND